ncbi:NitT/TauT family transport system permease protein [Lachnospiraceae bacterium KH1T2]|nr:NitT/TauT family transport system permease protein [Lachnospiraceae bacterium KH1T2]
MKRVYTQLIFIVAILAIWECISRSGQVSPLLFPSLEKIGKSFIEGFTKDNLIEYVIYSMGLIIKGLGIGILLALIFSGFSAVSKSFSSIYNFVVSVMDLIPGIALLPLAILWFGIGKTTVVVIVVHGVLWPMSRNIMDGFRSIPSIYIESGKNLGLNGIELVKDIYLPASFNSVLSGLRVGWARAWRGLISIEMVFGTTGSGAGIGWYIFMKRTNLDTAGVFASLLVIIFIGLIVEYGIFHLIEVKTVRKWGIIKNGN